MERPGAHQPLGLYLHIPFCSSICSYCNFNRGLFDAGLKTRYVRALECEIRRVSVSGGRGRLRAVGASASLAVALAEAGGDEVPPPEVDTIFFGGGTPSLLEPVEVGQLIIACRETFDLAAGAEITLETNPETATPERLAGFLAAGVNRISFGVQSFEDSELQRLGRVHTAARARDRSTDLARMLGHPALRESDYDLRTAWDLIRQTYPDLAPATLETIDTLLCQFDAI